jgi:hypothetical protein
VTDQGIAFDTNGCWWRASPAGGDHEADLPVDLAVLTEPETCAVLDTGKRRNGRPPADH